MFIKEKVAYNSIISRYYNSISYVVVVVVVVSWYYSILVLIVVIKWGAVLI